MNLQQQKMQVDLLNEAEIWMTHSEHFALTEFERDECVAKAIEFLKQAREIEK